MCARGEAQVFVRTCYNYDTLFMFVLVGLGNPGEKYAHSRHNTGRFLLERIAEKEDVSLLEMGKHVAHAGKGILNGGSVLFLLPNTFMNKSGSSVKTAVLNEKQAKNLVVVYDDLDLQLGTIRVAYGRSSGGHNGVESIIKALKTKDFVRIRVGVAPATPGGKLRKPKGEDAVIKFLMGDFGKKEIDELKKIEKKVREALEVLVKEGIPAAMNKCN